MALMEHARDLGHPADWLIRAQQTGRCLTGGQAVAYRHGGRGLGLWYRARWEIELFFHVLKNSCRVKALQLSTVERLERALALFMVVAWRIARLMRLGRTCPDFAREAGCV